MSAPVEQQLAGVLYGQAASFLMDCPWCGRQERCHVVGAFTTDDGIPLITAAYSCPSCTNLVAQQIWVFGEAP